MCTVPLLLFTAACAAGGGNSADEFVVDELQAEFDRRAAQVVQVWQEAGIAGQWQDGLVPLQHLTVVPEDAVLTEEEKTAVGAGWYRSAVELPDARPDQGTVSFPDGSTLEVPLVSAASAYQEMDQGDPPCPDGGAERGAPDAPATPGTDPGAPATGDPQPCTELVVTGVELGSVDLLTSRGVASTPAWHFTVEDQSAPIIRVAVDPSALGEVPAVRTPTPPYRAELVTAYDLVAVDGHTVTYRIGIGACDSDLTPLVHETAGYVVLGGSVVPPAPDEVCIDMLVLEEVTVTLDAPVGQRVLLSLTGEPLVLTGGR